MEGINSSSRWSWVIASLLCMNAMVRKQGICLYEPCLTSLPDGEEHVDQDFIEAPRLETVEGKRPIL